MAVTTKPKATQAVIEFSGPPRRLIAAGDLPVIAQADFEPSGKLAKYLPARGNALRIRNNPRRGGIAMKMKLAGNTPPGKYEGTIRSGKKSWVTQINVQTDLRASITPAELGFSAKPGTQSKIITTFHNLGNVDVTMPKTAPLGIFDDDGVEAAFASTYGKQFDDINKFLSNFSARLSKAHGGLMKLTVIRGAGTHPPGATALLEITADIPKETVRGHRYHGVWTTSFANLAVSVTIEK